MAYQVLARKWRPQKFDDVIGQQAVTRTLRNAIVSGRIAQAFVFAGQRGSGKTTTARILARALNCVNGPTADPCGVCDACIEIAQGRDIDVLEIDAASHTGIDTIREVIIDNLSFAPVRNRYKVFIIDEVHQLSGSSFNALLKSIEEPPAHVVFMMATTELHKIPDTILSRSQVFEFRTIPTNLITAQLRRIVDAEAIKSDDAALSLIARSAEGSMRDAQSALDQVIAFAGDTIGVDDVSTVLGLVGRDLLFDLVEAVIAEDGPRAFALADRAVESGHDLRLVLRELSRVVRDMMIVSVDPSRAGDGELAEGERERLTQLAARFSREDLMRAFDLLANAEQEIRIASHPRYHFEMALLKWMHTRRLVPLVDLLASGGSGGSVAKLQAPSSKIQAPSRPVDAPVPVKSSTTPVKTATNPEPRIPNPGSDNVKDKLLAEIRSGKPTFYNTVVAQARRIDVANDRVTFVFGPAHSSLRGLFDQQKAWLDSAIERIAGKKIPVVSEQSEGEPSNSESRLPNPGEAPSADKKRDLKAEAMSSSTVQAMLDVFPAEIRDVEETQ
ncbi:MAG TPA: DNA polymerase III subunit gamma/tau [Vicinamibacterales bacterium]|jgi:DNA polymerase-3 subunit gamma/tau|nr:DNA polymerase III subunit gamma/tau [Vicinamibacterales bacterium]